MQEFSGRVCVVTGGANGIGSCIVMEMAGRGCKVAFADKDKIRGKELEECLNQKGGEALFVPCDVGSKKELEQFAKTVIDRFHRVDYLIHNACFSNKGILSGCSYEQFNEVLRVGVTAPYYLTKLFLPYFVKGASIVNIASTRAQMSQKDTESYTAAKGGISALTHGLAMSLAGIARVNSISPGWIDVNGYQGKNYTPSYTEADLQQHPSKRVGIPEDIARTVRFLCSREAEFINGENINVDGGMTKRMIYDGDEGWSLYVETD
jgi:NAD(P)-dependent dehydrogenase (short-subunit alcohol dehydrogenase family)